MHAKTIFDLPNRSRPKFFEVPDYEFEPKFHNLVISTLVFNEPRYNGNILRKYFHCYF